MSDVDDVNVNEEAKVGIDYTKQFAKQAKQQLKMQCIDAAIRITEGDQDADILVAKAKAIYAFART